MDGVSGPTWRALRARIKTQAAATGTPCALCGQPIDWDAPAIAPASFQLDHIVPLSRGGQRYEPSNLQVTHRYCNRLKGDRTVSPKKVTNHLAGPQWHWKPQ